MGNLRIVFLFGLVICFLQGCDPGAFCGFYLVPNESYKPAGTNEAFKDDFKTADQLIEPFAIREGFYGYETPERFRKDYQRAYKEGNQTISIILLKDKDMIQISVWEMPSYHLSQGSQDICRKLVRQFQSEFGNERIKIDDDCKDFDIEAGK